MVQKKYTLPLVILIILLLFTFSLPLLSFFAPTATAQTNWSHISPDIDGDGLPNNVEEAGWCNAVGCFQTNPLDPDSDDDGLTDGEEKLFDANPTTNAGPGIYVLYEDTYKTREYYPWQPYGHKMIARGDNFVPPKPDIVDGWTGHGTDLDAIVARRGTTFYVGGPITGTLTYQKSDASLHNLTIAPQDPFNGQWQVTVPSTSSGTVGKYMLTLDGKSLDLFVIFELPGTSGSELTQLGIQKLLYDDDPGTTYDKEAVLLGDRAYSNDPGNYDDGGPDTYTIPSGQFIAEGLSYVFSTQQYNRYLLEDHVMDAINGKTSQLDATNALNDQVDALTKFRNPRPLYNSWRVINPPAEDPRNQCSNISGLVTGFNRAAGIPAHPVMVDWWKDSSFDHATEVWVDGEWRVYRGYSYYELTTTWQPYYGGLCAGDNSLWPACGNNKNQSRYDWGRDHYRPWHSGGGGTGNVIISADENWTGTGRAYRWASWDIARILLTPERLQTQNAKYWGHWGWTEEPVDYGGPWQWPDPPAGVTVLTSESVMDASAASGAEMVSLSPGVQFGQDVSERPVDTDSNGKYDQLVLEIEVTVPESGNYWLRGRLKPAQPDPSLFATGGIIAEALINVDLIAGTQIVPLAFTGKDIALSRVNGPYILTDLQIMQGEVPDPTAFMNASLAYGYNIYTTRPYQITDFETDGAMLTNNYSHYEADNDSDGRAEALVVTTGINIDVPGTYRVEGNIYNSQDEFVSHAVWSGSGTDVTLSFENVAGARPYQLRDLELFNAAGASIDYIYNAYIIEVSSSLGVSSASFDVYPVGDGLGALGTTITPTQNISTFLAGGNLVLEAEVEVSEAGNYKLEAWLADGNGNLVTWAMGQSTSLPTGLQTLSLTFPGRNIRVHGAAGPYQVVALKILDADVVYDVLDEVLVAVTTPAYTLDQFTVANNIILEDFAESNTGQWLADSPWVIQEGIHQYFGPSMAWYGSNADASLTLASPLDFSAEADLMLKMQTSYKFGAGETGYVEVSTDGNNWDVIKSFENTGLWSDEVVLIDLAAYTGTPMVHLRFRLDSAGGSSDDGWYIDNLLIVGAPDADADGIPDDEDPDADGDSILNVDEDLNNNGSLTDDDTDNDDIPNYLDNDDDGDGVLTFDEDVDGDGDPTNDDTDGDGTPNYLDNDDDGDGVLTAHEDRNGDDNPTNDNTDGDSLPNYLDPDDDGDGVNTLYEGANADGSGQNTDSDSLPDYLDPDDDGDGVDTVDEMPDPNGDGNPADARDTDGYYTPNTPDYLDPDDDGDGVDTADENDSDPDGDGVPNYLDPSNETSIDDDGDGVDTVDEDWNGDGDPTNDLSNCIPSYMNPAISEAPDMYIFLPIIRGS